MVFRSLTLTGEQIRAARALGRLEQAELARRSGLSLETIKRLERIRGPVDANSRTLTAISEAFRLIGIEFDTGEGEGVGVRLVASPAPARPIRSGGHGGAVGTMHRLIYYSTIAPKAAPRLKALLDEILDEARPRNASLGVTGALLFCNNHFLQVLEGEKHAVLQVYGAISSDPRHTGLQILESRPVASRQFQDWNLCCGIFEEDQEVFRHEPAMNEGFRPEVLTPASALGLLSMMRDLQQSSPRSLRLSIGRCPLSARCLDRTCVASAA